MLQVTSKTELPVVTTLMLSAESSPPELPKKFRADRVHAVGSAWIIRPVERMSPTSDIEMSGSIELPEMRIEPEEASGIGPKKPMVWVGGLDALASTDTLEAQEIRWRSLVKKRGEEMYQL